jgi:hypothetical protein
MRRLLLSSLWIGALSCGGATATVNDDAGAGDTAPHTEVDGATSDSGSDAGGIDATTDAGCAAPSTAPGSSIGGSCVQVMIAEDHGGGLRPPPPPGSDCEPSSAKYTYTVATASIAWSKCLGGTTASDPFKLKTGTSAVAASDAAALQAVLAAVKVATPSACGADKPLLTVTITTAGGTREYTDDFYACQGNGKVYVSDIDPLFAKLAELTK